MAAYFLQLDRVDEKIQQRSIKEPEPPASAKTALEIREESDDAHRRGRGLSERNAPIAGCACRFHLAAGTRLDKSNDGSRVARLRIADAPELRVQKKEVPSILGLAGEGFDVNQRRIFVVGSVRGWGCGNISPDETLAPMVVQRSG